MGLFLQRKTQVIEPERANKDYNTGERVHVMAKRWIWSENANTTNETDVIVVDDQEAPEIHTAARVNVIISNHQTNKTIVGQLVYA